MSIWVPFGGIAGVLCMVFTFLLWAEVKPPWARQRGGAPVTRQGTAKFVWVGALFTAGLTLQGVSAFIGLHPQHPWMAWTVVDSICVLDAILWAVLLRVTPSQPIFTPLQLRTLTLAKQLGELLDGIAPLKEISPEDYPDTREDKAKHTTAWAQRCAENNVEFAKVADRYAREFAHRVKDVVLEYGQEGFNEPELRQFLDGVTTQDALMIVRARLVCLAYRQAGIELSMSKTR